MEVTLPRVNLRLMGLLPSPPRLSAGEYCLRFSPSIGVQSLAWAVMGERFRT